MVKHKTQYKRNGKGALKKTKKQNRLSEHRYNQEGDQYTTDGYSIVRNEIEQYNKMGKLAKGFTVNQVDAILSKFLDEPRNIDGLRRCQKWTKYLLDSQTYAKTQIEFMREIFNLKHIALL